MREQRYFSIGFNHDTCPLETREILGIGEHEIQAALKSITSFNSISESVILSTCNRTEIYSLATNLEDIVSWYSQYRKISSQELLSILYSHTGKSVFQHACRVASGLDSMVLGETQIFGQLKDSVRMADSVGALGPKLRQLFDASFSVAKQVRTSTDIGAHSISLAAASAKVSERIFGSLSESKVLFIGAGEMNRLCGEYFATLNAMTLSFTNRTLSRAEALAEALNGSCFPITDITHRLHEFDIVVSCTGSPVPILGKGAIEKSLERRRNRPILLIDLAVPRDIEPKASELGDVFLYTVDDLGEIVRDGQTYRESAAREAEKIIDNRLAQFISQLESAKMAPVIKKFRMYGERIMQAELEKALFLIAKGEAPEKVVRALSRAISNKFMDGPSRALNNDSTGERLTLPEALEKLHGLYKN